MKYVMTALSVFGLDTILKHLFRKDETIREGKVLTKQTVFNPGFAGGRSADKPALIKAVSIAGLCSLLPTYVSTLREKGGGLLKCGMSLLLGGSLSNVYERLVHGKVTDYVRLKTGKKKLDNIVFNASDVFILGGAVLSLVGLLTRGKKR